MEQFQQYGLLGLVLYVVIKEVFGLLKKKEDKEPKDDPDKVVKDMQEWHQRQAMERMLTKLCDTLDHQTRVLEGIIEGQREFRQQLGVINDKVARI